MKEIKGDTFLDNKMSEITDIEKFKICSICGECFPCTEEYFYKNKTSKEGLFPYCKECTKQKTVNWMKNPNNRDKYLDIKRKNNKREKHKMEIKSAFERRKKEGYMLNYQRNNKDKIRKYTLNRQNKNHNISKEEWELCKAYFNYSCAYCGMTEKDHKEIFKTQLHKEHVDHEGSNDLDNCIPSCKSCNSQKWKFSLEEWYTIQDFFSFDRFNKIKEWLKISIKLKKSNKIDIL